MSKKPQEKKQSLDKPTAIRLLRTVSRNEGIELYRGPAEFTGKTATSLSDLAVKLKTVDVRAINHHFRRREFERWCRSTIGDEELARRLGRLDRELHGEQVRAQLIATIRTRLEELNLATAQATP
jgi:hypothetical protein